MDWGKGITLFFIVFVIGMLSLVFLATSQNQELVADDYYEQELHFQQKIEEKRNVSLLAEKPVFTVDNQRLELSFPASILGQPITGSVYLFRHSSQKLDIKTPLALNEAGKQTVFLDKSATGAYELQLSWQANNTNYYIQQEVYFK